MLRACPKFTKERQPVEIAKRIIDRAKRDQWQKLTKYVRDRDRVCRLCRTPGVEVHHVEFRSRGGKDVAANAVLLCRRCHQDVHAHLIKLAGDAQKKRGLKVGRYSDETSDYVWGTA